MTKSLALAALIAIGPGVDAFVPSVDNTLGVRNVAYKFSTAIGASNDDSSADDIMRRVVGCGAAFLGCVSLSGQVAFAETSVLPAPQFGAYSIVNYFGITMTLLSTSINNLFSSYVT
jgi:hypothetical protein